MQIENGGRRERRRAGCCSCSFSRLVDGLPDGEEEMRPEKKLKFDKSRRQFEGGSAPSGQGGLTVVITDDSSEEWVKFQGKSENI